MNKRVLTFIPAALLALALAACSISIDAPNVTVGSGKMASETRQVSGFNAVTLAGSGDVSIEQGEQEALTIEADDNILPLLTSEVRGGELVLGMKPNLSLNLHDPIHYTLTVKNLNAFTLSGSGNVQAGPLQTDSLRLVLSGSGNVRLSDLTAQRIDTTLSGSGSIDVAGKVDEQSAQISGSGEYRAGDLASTSASTGISGSGSMKVWATDRLDARISGSGSVSYYGRPTVNKTGGGSGELRSLGDH